MLENEYVFWISTPMLSKSFLPGSVSVEFASGTGQLDQVRQFAVQDQTVWPLVRSFGGQYYLSLMWSEYFKNFEQVLSASCSCQNLRRNRVRRDCQYFHTKFPEQFFFYLNSFSRCWTCYLFSMFWIHSSSRIKLLLYNPSYSLNA